ncbi:hypothetical protein FHS83_002400 [Rhizomicrobium palustre]|uniref:DOMON-like domain-containing protein n=1 Tax=Rhizomicrobium palustre TaxID=189966 RepID=A0A846N1I1_9PROT|nr:DOMON-like domain-containing protein [Rhizomicrobium palustre]NIK89082.1 hypothetical protein [Rhizomicrobium palustre]
MLRALRLHPDSRRNAAARIEVGAIRPEPDLLFLRYSLKGNIASIALPAQEPSERRGELWRHSCFEAFIKLGSGYGELNFSPSTCWAAYSFEGYRAGMQNWEVAKPEIAIRQTAEEFVLEAGLRLPGITGPFVMGLSAVVEDKDGAMSYWALQHPAGKPDFHHAETFSLELS